MPFLRLFNSIVAFHDVCAKRRHTAQVPGDALGSVSGSWTKALAYLWNAVVPVSASVVIVRDMAGSRRNNKVLLMREITGFDAGVSIGERSCLSGRSRQRLHRHYCVHYRIDHRLAQ